jgi:hypothetical protein
MHKVLFTISYTIIPEKREEYIALMKEMHDHLVGQKQKKYGVYEVRGKKNSFTEVFLCDTMEEFDALEDDQDETTESFVQRLEDFLENGKMKYSTLVDIFD